MTYNILKTRNKIKCKKAIIITHFTFYYQRCHWIFWSFKKMCIYIMKKKTLYVLCVPSSSTVIFHSNLARMLPKIFAFFCYFFKSLLRSQSNVRLRLLEILYHWKYTHSVQVDTRITQLASNWRFVYAIFAPFVLEIGTLRSRCVSLGIHFTKGVIVSMRYRKVNANVPKGRRNSFIRPAASPVRSSGLAQ